VIQPENKRSLFIRNRWLRWVVIGFAICFVILYVVFRSTWQTNFSSGAWVALDALILALLIALAYAAYDRWQHSSAERNELAGKLAHAEAQLDQAYQRQAAVLRISQLFTEAKDENEVVEQVLAYAMDLLGAKGATFVPLDEQAQPQAAVSVGLMPKAVN
jgi:K+ transporter